MPCPLIHGVSFFMAMLQRYAAFLHALLPPGSISLLRCVWVMGAYVCCACGIFVTPVGVSSRWCHSGVTCLDGNDCVVDLGAFEPGVRLLLC